MREVTNAFTSTDHLTMRLLAALCALGAVNYALQFFFFAGAFGMLTEVRAWLQHETDNLATLIGSFAVLFGLFLTSRQWKADNNYKRDEVRSRRHQEYRDRLASFRTWQTDAAILMILHYDRDIVIRKDKGAERVNWHMSAKALVPATFRRYLYESKITAIRDCYNDYLENLSRLFYLEQDGLISSEDTAHLCKSMLVRIGGAGQFAGTSLARNFRLYVQWRGAHRVIDLFMRYGCDIKSRKAEDIRVLTMEIAEGRYGKCTPSSWGTL